MREQAKVFGSIINGSCADTTHNLTLKKARGVYYTPSHIVDYVVQHTIGSLLSDMTPKQAAKLRILDPACGSGLFLLGAYRFLLDWHHERSGQLSFAEKRQILLSNIYGVDIDPLAVEETKLSLLKMSGVATGEHELSDLACNIRCGNSLIGSDFQKHPPERVINSFDWPKAFPQITKAGGFDAVIGNPPWGQKAIDHDPALKRYLQSRYPSARGIHDVFRPFVELAIGLLADGGMFGFVLPDIVLLKNYAETRRLLLERLALTRLDWWDMPFPGAVIDAASVIGTKRSAPPDHCVRACVRDGAHPIDHQIPQADFWANPRLAFNLHLTAEKRRLLEQLACCPKLGDYFEVHEGVHSGNMRRELFVRAKVDETCRDLYFGRGEMVPYHLQWQGKYIHLAVLPQKKTRQRYANLGKPEWHERAKLLVRRTGDHVLAAVDDKCRFASNNFFVVIPRQSCSLDLNGLCALLNSEPMTWYFRTIEPRRGRAFAELKIKHLNAFPLPLAALRDDGCTVLNALGAQRAIVAAQLATQSTSILQTQAHALDPRIDALVRKLLGLPLA